MTTHADIYAFMRRVVTLVNNPSLNVPAINLSGLNMPESMQHVAGLYLASLSRYLEAVTRGGGDTTIGYAELSRSLEVLIAARHGFYQLGATRQFGILIFSPDESDEVLTSLTLQEFDQFSRTNIYMLMGRAAICTEQSDADVMQFANWLDLQLHNLSMFCYAHDIDLTYILYQIFLHNKPQTDNEPSVPTAE